MIGNGISRGIWMWHDPSFPSPLSLPLVYTCTYVMYERCIYICVCVLYIDWGTESERGMGFIVARARAFRWRARASAYSRDYSPDAVAYIYMYIYRSMCMYMLVVVPLFADGTGTARFSTRWFGSGLYIVGFYCAASDFSIHRCCCLYFVCFFFSFYSFDIIMLLIVALYRIRFGNIIKETCSSCIISRIKISIAPATWNEPWKISTFTCRWLYRQRDYIIQSPEDT